MKNFPSVFKWFKSCSWDAREFWVGKPLGKSLRFFCEQLTMDHEVLNCDVWFVEDDENVDVIGLDALM